MFIRLFGERCVSKADKAINLDINLIFVQLLRGRFMSKTVAIRADIDSAIGYAVTSAIKSASAIESAVFHYVESAVYWAVDSDICSAVSSAISDIYDL